MPFVAAGIVLAALLLAWAGVELDHVIHAYPAQFWFGAAAVLIVAFSMAAARFRVAGQRVPLRPAAPALPPLPKAIQAAPVLTAVASGVAAEEAQPCEGPGCAHKVDSDPYLAHMPWETFEHRFCSEPCVRGWERLQKAPQGA